MALTIHQEPQAYTPSDNPVTWVFSSDQTLQPNFYFFIEVMIGNPTFVTVENHKVYPEFGNKSHFDASSIAERYAIVNSGNYYNNQTLSKIKITITEYYNGVSGASVTSSESTIFKAKMKKSLFVDYDYNDYILNASSTNSKFLTTIPRGYDKAKGEEKKLITVLTDGSASNFTFKTYTSGGVLIDSIGTSFIAGDNMLNIVCGVQELIDDISLNFTGASYYTITGNIGAGTTEVYRINIDDNCDYSRAKRLHFLNSLGGIDAFTFGLISREKTEVKSFGFERQFGYFNDAGVYEFDLERGTVVDYLKQFGKSLETTSDWLVETVQNWLSSELYTSPIVWIEDGVKLYRCKVTNTSYEKKIQENDMLFQEVVSIELESDTSVNV